MEQGLVQLYTGDGKGKTTAAMGLALRAAGRGRAVTVVQFLKAEETGEVLIINERLPQIRIIRTARQAAFSWSLDQAGRDRAAEDVREGIGVAQGIMAAGGCDLLVLDEIVTAAAIGYCRVDDILALIAARPPALELVLTGRGATPELIGAADLVTEMRKVCHPFDRGIGARRGIEQ